MDASSAQTEIHKLTKENKKLQEEYSRLEAQMKSMKPNSPEYAKAEKELKALASTIDINSRKIAELGKQTKDSEKTLVQLRKELNASKKLFENTSKSLQPEEYARLRKRIRELKDAIHEANGETQKMSSAWTSLKKMQNVLIGVFFTIGQSITENIIGAFKSAFSIITDFESANAKLASVLGVTKDQIAELEKGARKLGATTSYSAAEVTQLQIRIKFLDLHQHRLMMAIGNVRDSLLILRE